MLCVVLHLVARSFCVILGSIFCRCSLMTDPTSLPIVFGLTMSSLRSTLVRCCPSTPGLEDYFVMLVTAKEGQWGIRKGELKWQRETAELCKYTYRVTSAKFLLGANDGSASLSCVQRTLASNNSLACSPSAPTGLASNLGNGLPVFRHCIVYASVGEICIGVEA